jgi:hypothetical protein
MNAIQRLIKDVLKDEALLCLPVSSADAGLELVDREP